MKVLELEREMVLLGFHEWRRGSDRCNWPLSMVRRYTLERFTPWESRIDDGRKRHGHSSRY